MPSPMQTWSVISFKASQILVCFISPFTAFSQILFFPSCILCVCNGFQGAACSLRSSFCPREGKQQSSLQWSTAFLKEQNGQTVDKMVSGHHILQTETVCAYVSNTWCLRNKEMTPAGTQKLRSVLVDESQICFFFSIVCRRVLFIITNIY